MIKCTVRIVNILGIINITNKRGGHNEINIIQRDLPDDRGYRWGAWY